MESMGGSSFRFDKILESARKYGMRAIPCILTDPDYLVFTAEQGRFLKCEEK